jgi:isoquinoline 1-oxidoreductase
MTASGDSPSEGVPHSDRDPERVVLTVNGTDRLVPSSAVLLFALRDELGLTGAKPGCGEGACGSCTVLVDGEPVRACQQQAGSMAGRRITTIEGLADGERLHPVQRAFAALGAAQCGYCTPGMILSTVALLASDPEPDDSAINEGLAGNICRCGCYSRIRQAVHRAVSLTTAGEHGAVQAEPAGHGVAASVAGSSAADRWGPPEPGSDGYRPSRPWDLTEPAERDWFGALGDGLVVVAPPSAGTWSTSGGAWLHIGTSGIVTAFTGKVDVGQDNRTALRQLVAEELRIPLAQVRLTMADTDLCPYDMGTFGSRSMPDAGSALRRAAAHARTLLPEAAGTRHIEIMTSEPVLRSPADWQVAGRPQVPPGTVAAVTGTRRFVTDLAAAGMGHGAVLRPPAPGARLRELDCAAARHRPGVLVVQSGELTGVVAPDLVTARLAIADLAAAAGWDLPQAPSDATISEYLLAHPVESGGGPRGGPFHHEIGDVDAAFGLAAVRVQATYTAAYIAPAPLETRVALAVWDTDGRLTIWTGTQAPFPVRAQVAAAVGLAEDRVRVIVPPTGGGFGGRHAAGIAIEAAVLARHAGRPVRIAWSRHEEFTVGTLRPAAVIDVASGSTTDGVLTAWTHRNVNSGQAAITTPYRVPHQRLDYQPAAGPLLQAAYRGLAATANNFARESQMDELAERLGQDPVEFRLRNLADSQLADVLRAVAQHVEWGRRAGTGKPSEPPSPTEQPSPPGPPPPAESPPPRPPSPERIGWGIACGSEKAGRVATAAQVRIGPDGQPHVIRLVTGYECGAIVNPETVTSQVEGATVMALGGALLEAISFTDGVITNGAFSAYRVPRMADVPLIEVILLDRPDLPSAGAGETPMIAVAPAIASAIFDATGQRLRSLPLAGGGPVRALADQEPRALRCSSDT